jgi:hypothetical protein
MISETSKDERNVYEEISAGKIARIDDILYSFGASAHVRRNPVLEIARIVYL